MLNKVILIGRLGREPELRYMANGEAVCNFSVATSESWKDSNGQKKERTEWHHVTMYHKLANIAVIQVQNKLSLRSGAPQDLDSKLTENIKNLMHYQALVYDNDRSSVTVFEKLIRAMRVVACIYSDSDLSKTTNEAQAAIEQLSESDDLSPNQRREILKPVLRLTEYQEAYGEIIPERTVSKIGLY